MGTFDRWFYCLLSLGLFIHSCIQLGQSRSSGQHSETGWRVAYVIAFGTAVLLFSMLPPVPTPWRPSVLLTVFRWPLALVWLFLAAAIYGLVEERRSRRKPLGPGADQAAV